MFRYIFNVFGYYLGKVVSLSDFILHPISTQLKKVFNQPVEAETNTKTVLFSSSSGLNDFWKQYKDEESPFLIGDMADIVRKYNQWNKELPMVEPFYAIKSNPDPIILNILASLGVGFDCASKMEMDSVLNLGVPPSRLIFASTCKFPSHLRRAAEAGVRLVTFDGEHELHKIREHHPHAQLVIRLIADEKHVVYSMGRKFGCELKEVAHLARVAKDLQLQIVGVSFHVGFNHDNAIVFANTIASCKEAFAIAESQGHRMTLLDIGGGFLGSKVDEKHTLMMFRAVRESLSEHFPPESGVRVIAEPGKFFSEAAFTLYTRIIGKRERGEHTMYYMNDGLYGSLQFYTSHLMELRPRPLVDDVSGRPVRPSSLWGPTCDSADKILDDCPLPDMRVGEWIAIDDMGAYSHAGATNFNGFEKPRRMFVFPKELESHFEKGSKWDDLCIKLKEHVKSD